jgi:hypothetical protein
MLEPNRSVTENRKQQEISRLTPKGPHQLKAVSQPNRNPAVAVKRSKRL